MTYDTQLTLSVPTDWLPALYGQGTDNLNDADRIAFLRWKCDMQRDFGEFYVETVEHFTFFDTMHEGTEYGAKPTRCRNAVLAVEECR